MVITIDRADYKGDYVISIHFSDGVKKNIDFREFLQNAKNPMTKKYLDKELFKSFTLDYGDLMWNDYEMCFPIWNLHEGKI
jgi:hypothetical protein